ncbi:MAG: LD-carboxypeptidase [Chitinophagaceae bacterium]
MITIPPYLKKGDTIGLVAPAGYMHPDKMQTCLDSLEDWGYNISLGSTAQSNSHNYFSGTDTERLRDLQLMMDDKNINAVMCVRGGYGMSRIIDDLNFKKFVKNPKWLIGFSDITVLQAHVFSRYKIASLHAPMAAAFNEGGFNSIYIQSLKEALEGKAARYDCAPISFNKKGTASGILVGGNLSILVHLLGTKSELKTKDKILFLEDVGEYLYTIDRMLLQLKRSGKLDKLEGLIIGGFTECKDTERPFGKEIYDLIYDQVKEFNYPICFGFPVSHEKENYALKMGGNYSLTIEDAKVVLEENISEEENEKHHS